MEFKVPERCPLCGAASGFAVESTVSGTCATMAWQCKACDGTWPVDPREWIERRTGSLERRRMARTDRRRRRKAG
jgi:hypothetical protein